MNPAVAGFMVPVLAHQLSKKSPILRSGQDGHGHRADDALLGESSGPVAMDRPETARDSSSETPSWETEGAPACCVTLGAERVNGRDETEREPARTRQSPIESWNAYEFIMWNALS